MGLARLVRGLTVCCILLALLVGQATGQRLRDTRRVHVILEGGTIIPRLDVDSRIGAQGGLLVGYQLTPNWQFQVGARYAQTSELNDRFNRTFTNDIVLIQARMQYFLRYLMGPDASPRFLPFVTLGLTGVGSSVSNTTFTGVPSEAIDYTGTDFAGGLGLGATYRLNDRLDLRLAAEYYVSNTDRLDGHDWPGPSNQGNDHFLLASVGLSYHLGKANKPSLAWTPPAPAPSMSQVLRPTPVERRPHYFSDRDQDGVADSLDLDNNTPAGVRVTTRGVPMDTDYDGVADYLDPCPVVPGTDGKGCPEPEMPIDSATARPQASGAGLGYLIIAGSMTNRENAARLLERMQKLGFKDARILTRTYSIVGGSPTTFYRVAISRHASREDALDALRALSARLQKQDLWIYFDP